MDAAIIGIGTEIMRGQIDDTNSTFISRWLDQAGIITKWRINVDDAIENITNAIRNVQDCDIIIFTGGLGPTEDDCTTEAVAKFLKSPLLFSDQAWEMVTNFYKRFDRKIPESNKKQAMIIEGGDFIPNKLGTAPGVYYKSNDKIYILLPGPPNENQFMINNFLLKILEKNSFLKGSISTDAIRLYNLGESKMADMLKGIDIQCNIGYYFHKEGWIEINLYKFGTDNNENKKLIDDAMKKIKSILKKENIFYTENKPLGEILLNKLKEKKLTISFAESITGGNLASELIKNPGASDVMLGGIIAYSNEAKKEILDVSNETLKKFGAVSEEVAREMVEGLKNKFHSSIAVSVTGIAGPTGGSEDKPVGLVFIGIAFKDKIIIKKEIFPGIRARIISRCTKHIYTKILEGL